MPIELKMPALSPTMEHGTLAKWLVKEGDAVVAGDLLAEIETDKATMEFEAVDEGVIARILIPEGSDEVKVGTVIALIAGEGEETKAPAPPPPAAAEVASDAGETGAGQPARDTVPSPPVSPPATAVDRTDQGERIKVSPLARRLAQQRGIDLAALRGSGPGGRIIKADIDGAAGAAKQPIEAAPQAAPVTSPGTEIPHEVIKLSSMRKTIARRLTESKQQIPHIYLTVDIRLDDLLRLRAELNASLEGRGIKLSVNDMLVKALAAALAEVPSCNVRYTSDELLKFSRVDISVAVSIPNGLITPVIAGAEAKSLSAIATEMKDLAARAREGKLAPHEYQGGTASLSNMGMYGIKQFDAVINPPQAMIMAVGAGEKRPYLMDDALGVATVMSATGSFDHRAIDGADGAALMQAFKRLIEKPLGMLV